MCCNVDDRLELDGELYFIHKRNVTEENVIEESEPESLVSAEFTELTDLHHTHTHTHTDTHILSLFASLKLMCS